MLLAWLHLGGGFQYTASSSSKLCCGQRKRRAIPGPEEEGEGSARLGLQQLLEAGEGLHPLPAARPASRPAAARPSCPALDTSQGSELLSSHLIVFAVLVRDRVLALLGVVRLHIAL